MIDLRALVQAYRADAKSVYTIWFLWPERIGYFRTIRSAVKQVVEQIRAKKFPNVYKSSSLEVVVSSIAEQKQMFKGADHPFVWKPKLRIPDIYEDEANKQYFADFLESCLNFSDETRILDALDLLISKRIKGLKAAITNICYFLHPTIFPAYNTAIVRGYNRLFEQGIKLGDWEDYLKMREGIIAVNNEHRGLLSKDLGAVSGLLFDIGIGRFREALPPDAAEPILPRVDRFSLNTAYQKIDSAVEENTKHEREHTKIEYLLIKMGRALGYDIWVASNDRSCICMGEKFSELTLAELPKLGFDSEVTDTIRMIDVIWLRRNIVEAAFEVEHSTSIYSGICRLADLAKSVPNINFRCYLVGPDEKKEDLAKQLKRPVFDGLKNVEIKYILYNRLREKKEAIEQFASDISALDKIALRAHE